MKSKNWINPSSITYTDFYDQLLYRYYGKLYYAWDKAEGDFTVELYYWNGKFYMDKVTKYED
jgi:hypothetical protein